MWNLPNILTLLRIVLIPVLVVVYYLPWPEHFMLASGVFVVASLTDWLDGHFARKMNLSTEFGAFLDPVADKLIVATALILLLETHSTPWFAIPALIIIGREIVISALREWMAEIGERASVAVSSIGKIKTGFQMLSIIVLLAADPQSELIWVGMVLLYVAAIMTLWSMVIYLKAAWIELRKRNVI
jgi:CDP-diacylglycerol--glycerol-3-phosphate 3-phosphatidyltransferase